MAAQDCPGAIDLLEKNGTRQFVRKSHGRQREKQVGTSLPFGWETVVRSDEKDQILPDELGLLENSRKLIGVHGFAPGIEKDLSSTAMFGK